MADTTTTAYGLTKPEIGASEDTWGDKINTNLDTLDSTIDAIGGKTAAGTLKYANSAKLATTSTGVDVTGTVTADGLTVDGKVKIALGTALVDADNSSTNLTVHDGDGSCFVAVRSDNVSDVGILFGDSADDFAGGFIYQNSGDILKVHVNNTERLRIDASGNVGIGEDAPAWKLHIENGANADLIQVIKAGGAGYIGFGVNGSAAVVTAGTSAAAEPRDLVFKTANTAGVESERMRIDASGNLLVGLTAPQVTGTAAGFQVDDGAMGATAVSAASGYFSRKTTDGDIVVFRKDTTTVGSIDVSGGNSFRFLAAGGSYTNACIGSGDTGFIISSADSIRPYNPSNSSSRDNAIGFGESYARWVDIWAVDGTINTSDGNEKQQVYQLTAQEMQAAKELSKLFRMFKWNSAVSLKGDAARKHAGVIAQDVQQTMADAGLDAGDYAFFISSTWWETQTEVPAVEAVAAQDAVYEDVIIPAVLDEEGNEIEPERTEQRLVSEAVEAVEAREAHTRTDTYDTLEEAPEGATERTRLGIRYPELLAFIGAATEQRLASIEARLDAAGM